MATPTNSKTVWIDCPRCGGRGVGTWHPDNGVCYRCRGNGEVRVDVDRTMAALRFLRAEYVRLRHEARKGDEMAAESLRYCVEDGLRVRATLEAAGVAIPG